jgi:hypothetical protein
MQLNVHVEQVHLANLMSAQDNAPGLDTMVALATAEAAVFVAAGENFHGRKRSQQTVQGFVTAFPDGRGFLRGKQGHA